MPGNPGRLKPVVWSSVPWLWTPVLPTMLWMKAMSSTTVAERRDDLAELLAALAVGLEVPDRLEPRAEAVLERLDVLAEVRGLPCRLTSSGLKSNRSTWLAAAGHEELHDALGLGLVVQPAVGEQSVVAEHRRQRDAAQPAAGVQRKSRRVMTVPSRATDRTDVRSRASITRLPICVIGVIEHLFSIHEHELVQVQDHAAGVRQAVLLRRTPPGPRVPSRSVAAEGQPECGGDAASSVVAQLLDALREVLRHRHHELVVEQGQRLLRRERLVPLVHGAATGRHSRARP